MAAATLSAQNVRQIIPSRDVRLDALRGLCLVVMTIDHLPFRDNLASHITWRPLGFFSGAAVFVFLAGYLASRIRGANWAWQRAGHLYLAHAALVTAVAICIVLGNGTWAEEWRAVMPGYFQHPWPAWAASLLLWYLPSDYLCILPLYVTLFLLLPVLYALMRRGYADWMLSGSALLWAVAQAGIGTPPDNPFGLHTGYFNPLAWQFVFVAGVWTGFRKPRLWHSRALFVWTAVAAGALFILRHPKLAGSHATLFEAPDRTLSPLVVLNFAVWLYGWTYLPQSWTARAGDFTVYQALVRLGRHSLPVFVTHQVLGFGLMLLAGSAEWEGSLQMFTISVTLAVLLQVADFAHLRGRKRDPAELPSRAPGHSGALPA